MIQMNKNMVILDALARKEDPFTLDELYEAIEGSISERTLRRMLKDLAEQGKINLIGGNRNRRYQLNHVEQSIKELSPDSTLDDKKFIFSEHSLTVYQKLKLPLYTREPCTYNELWLMSYIPNETFYLSEKQRKILAESGGQKTYDQEAGTYANKIYDRLLIDLSYNSSRLEGNTYTLIDTQKLLLEGKAADDKMDADRIMILNHKEAIRFLVKSLRMIELSEESIRTLHYLLSDGLVLPKDSGNIREEEIKISGSTYIPLGDRSRIERVFSAIIEKAKNIQNVFEQSFFLLVHISYIQAFIDVNKRTARLTANIPIVNGNYIPISFNYIEKEDYRMAVIAIYELNDITLLLDLFIFSYTRTCKEYQVICDAISFDPQRVRYRQERRNLIANIIKEKMKKENFIIYIEKEAQKFIPRDDQRKFIHDVLDDLYHLDIVRLAGLGVSRQEFEAWKVSNLKKE